MIIDTEEELLHATKQWFKKHGLTILIIFLLFLSIGVGWYAAKRQNNNRLSQASILYEEVLQSMSRGDSVSAEKQIKALTEMYRQTLYAKLAALLSAKNLVEDGKLDLAREQLTWVIEKAEMPGVRQIARIRLAKIWLSENQHKEALSALQSIDDPAFTPLIEEVKGDIQGTSGHKDAARLSYQEAIKTWPANLPGKELIKLKLQQISSNP